MNSSGGRVYRTSPGRLAVLALCFPRFGRLSLVGISLVVGVGFEVLQSFTGRDADPFDVLRNLIGTGIAVLMMRAPGARLQQESGAARTLWRRTPGSVLARM